MKTVTPLATMTGLVVLAACAPTEREEPMIERPPLVELLASGQVVFGMFSGAKTQEQGLAMGQNGELDFVFYSLENGPFDIPTMQSYMAGMAEGGGAEVRPVALRIPPIGDAADEARDHTRQGLAASAGAIVYPHVTKAGDVALAASVMGDDLWPVNPNGSLINMMIIEDQAGIARAREIVSAPGVSVAIPGPGDLRRAYAGDMEAVENAIQTVLGLCKEFNVPCGITAGPEDIELRIEQGFRVFILSDPETLRIGRAAAGRAE